MATCDRCDRWDYDPLDNGLCVVCVAVEHLHWLRFCEAWVAIGLAALHVNNWTVFANCTEYLSEDSVRLETAVNCGYSTEGAT